MIQRRKPVDLPVGAVRIRQKSRSRIRSTDYGMVLMSSGKTDFEDPPENNRS